jgi:hypothetical protein
MLVLVAWQSGYTYMYLMHVWMLVHSLDGLINFSFCMVILNIDGPMDSQQCVPSDSR